MRRIGSIAAAVAACFGVAGSAMADGPAVSAPNAKVSVGGGDSDGDGTGLFFGSVTIPVGNTFGAQVDVLVGESGGDTRWGVSGHLFWRDPDTGLIGVLGSYSSRNDHEPDSIGRVGVEGEIYLGRFTGLAYGGYQYGDVDDGEFGRLDLRWYVTDDVMLAGGGEVETGDLVGRLGGEFQPGLSALPGLSVFAEGEIGDDDWSRVFAGIRYYFGDTKSLIRRHREDDPGKKSDEFPGRRTETGGDGGMTQIDPPS